MFENFFWWLRLPNELKLPHLTYSYFSKASTHPFEHQASTFSLTNAAWLTDLSYLVYADQDFFTQKVKDAGFTGEPVFIGFDSSDESTQCAIVHNADMLVVIFRGTEFSPKRIKHVILDLTADLKAEGIAVPELNGNIHAGFFSEVEKNYDEIAESIKKIHTNQAIWFTGHSMGGALAIITAQLLAHRQQQSINGIYTIGCPRVGDANFVEHFQIPLYCLINNQDPVPRIPTQGYSPDNRATINDYQPMGEIRYFDSEGKLHDIDKNSTQAKEFLNPGSTFLATFLPNMFDHAPYRYSQNIWKRL